MRPLWTYAQVTQVISEVTICFSIEIDKNINKLSGYFGAMIKPSERSNLQRTRWDTITVRFFFEENQIENWPTPEGKTKKEIYEILGNREKVIYEFEWVS